MVSKMDGNPFLTSILLYNNHRNVNTVELKSAEIPIGFYNIRSPYNTFIVNGVTYTVPPGNYTIDTLIDAMNFTSPYIFSRNGNRIVITLGNPLPEAVTNFVASNPQETTVDLVWDPALYATEYSIETFPISTTETTSDTTYTFPNLEPDTEYTFTITPVNATGNGPSTNSDPISTLLPYPGYAPFINNTPVSATTTTIELTWSTDPPYPPSYATSYNVYCYDIATYEVLDVQSCSLTPPYTFTGLQTNYGYYFNLSSVNARGEQESPSAGSDFMYTVPTVTGLSVSNPTATTVDITWDAITTNLSPYDFNYVITSTQETTTQNSSGVPPYTFPDLTPDTSYTFTVTPQVAYNFLTGDPVTSDPISTLLPLPGFGPSTGYSDPPNPQATTIDLVWFEYVPEYATSFNVYAYSVLDGLIGFVNVPISSFSYTYTGLTPGTEYYFTVAGVNATGVGEAGGASVSAYTLIQVNLAYTGTIETLELIPGNYNFQMAGGSGPLRSEVAGGAGRCFAEYTFLYTVEDTITIQYAIGQASPGDVGGAGGTYIYDQTNSQWLFIAGGAGTNDFSPNPADNAPGDGSGGAAGSGGGSGAGVSSNGSNSTVSAGSGGLTFGNGCTGGTAGTFGDSPQPGGFGGGGGGTRVYDPALPVFYGEYAYYPGGGGGYTGGTTDTAYTPEVSTTWFSGYGTSYMIPGATVWGYNTNQGGAPVTNGYINININLE
jgi:hypothetical protein